MVALPTGTVAFLFTDIEGSTRLWEEHEAEMAAALALHDGLMRSTIDGHGGFVFSTAGDAFAAAFRSCSEAVGAALEMQAQLRAAPWPTPEPVAVRIGLHVGEAHERDGDYFGPTVNRAARIMSAAHGGQIVMSSAFRELVPSVGLRDLGRHRLKDLTSAEQLWQLDDGDFPGLRTLNAVHHNLPVERTLLVGRAEEVERVIGLVEAHRLVSVIGIGGTGKTRLATAAAAEIADRYLDGVWFVDLVPAVDASDVATAMAAATGLQVPGHDVVSGLAEVLDGRTTIFVIDNCEHVTEAVGEVLDVLLTRTSTARFLATSREPLELFDEVQFALDPLDATNSHSPAAELFVEAADRVGRRPTSDESDVVASICHHLDGHPLSIELAAAQLKQLTVAQLADRLDRRFELLTRSQRGRRHESLIAVLEDTWEMLDAHEQQMLTQLAAFPSSFGIADVEAVCSSLDVGLPSRTFGGLVDRSVVSSGGEDRHRLLETVKLFVRGRWRGDGAVERHEAWLMDHLRGFPSQARFTSFALSDWIEEHLDDWLSIERRLAVSERWSELGELCLMSQVLFHNTVSGALGLELLARFERYLDSVPDSEDRCRAIINLSLANLGLVARRADWIERGSAVAIDLFADGTVDQAYALVIHSWMVAIRDVDAALEVLDRVVVDAEARGAPRVADVALGYRANHLALAGRGESARVVLDELAARFDSDEYTYGRHVHLSVSMSVNIVDDPGEAYHATNQLLERDERLAHLTAAPAATSGHLADAHRRFERAIDRKGTLYPDDGLPDLLIPVAAAAYAVGEHDRCRTLLTAVRNAPKPTQTFMTTIQYRELRNAVGLDAENPLDARPIEEIFEDSCTWFHEMVRARRSPD